MALLRREPREVYRVYGAQEFLAGAEGEGHEPAPVSDGASPAQPSSARRSRMPGGASRALRAAVFSAGVALACGLIVARNMQSTGGRGRQPSPTMVRAGVSPGDAVVADGPPRHAAPPALRPSRPQRSLSLGPRRRAASKPGSPAAASTAPRSGQLAVAARAEPPQPQAHVEFGFER
ncbi:MAG: hypothetical protein JWO23_945 [Solirubrobacterales bacterium]|nr:hypothetical protein [Solirubrobacterales bacterium]